MKACKFLLSILLFILPLISCSKPKVNVLIVPTNKDAYCTAKLISTDWKGTNTIELHDNKNNIMTCEATSRMTQDSLTCVGKKYNVDLQCFHNRQADVNITTTSCHEAYGVATGDRGDEYDIYIGLSDGKMKEKIAELSKTIKRE